MVTLKSTTLLREEAGYSYSHGAVKIKASIFAVASCRGILEHMRGDIASQQSCRGESFGQYCFPPESRVRATPRSTIPHATICSAQ